MKHKKGIVFFIVILLITEGLFITGLILALKTPAGNLGLIFLITSSILMLVPIMIAAFRFLWNPLIANFPAIEVPRHATRKKFQSFKFGIVNMGLSIHAATDQTHLHLEPIMPLRMLGARSASIPFDAMTLSDRGRSVQINGTTLYGPRWCFESLASND